MSLFTYMLLIFSYSFRHSSLQYWNKPAQPGSGQQVVLGFLFILFLSVCLSMCGSEFLLIYISQASVSLQEPSQASHITNHLKGKVQWLSLESIEFPLSWQNIFSVGVTGLFSDFGLYCGCMLVPLIKWSIMVRFQSLRCLWKIFD